MLAAGGSAADAAVAACLASCVAETVMTGLLGGGHAIYYDAAIGPRAQPRLLRRRARPRRRAGRRAELLELEVPFGDRARPLRGRDRLVRRARACRRGSARCTREHGRLPWARLVEPALRLARDGVEFPPAHAACLAMLEPVMTMNEGARDLRAGRRAAAGGRRGSSSRGSCARSSCSPTRAPRARTTGTIGEALLELMDERGGLVTRDDLAAYEAALVGAGRGRLRGHARS